MPPTEAREAVLTALRIAGVDVANGGQTALPTARTRAAVDLLSNSNPDDLAEQQVDLRSIIRDLLDWDQPRATKSVIRTAGKAMTSRLDNGAALWPHAISALSYVAVWSPLLDPDRLDRVLTHAATTHTAAYTPIRYAAAPAAQLQRLVGHYSPVRLEALALSLWDAAHNGRWWDVCGGLGSGPRRRRRRGRDELEADMEARTRAIAAASEDGRQVVSELLDGTLTHWTPVTAAALRDVRLTGPALAEVMRYAEESHDDPDVGILLAQLVDLPPAARPENPIPIMIDALEFLLDEADPKDVLPKKPSSWAALYPKGSLREYPIPLLVQQWDWATLPGVDGATIELIRSPHALFENRDYMGNCTGGYSHRCATGEWVLAKLHYDKEMYNISITVDGAGGRWRASEINSRFNGGRVPTELREGFDAWVVALNSGQKPK